MINAHKKLYFLVKILILFNVLIARLHKKIILLIILYDFETTTSLKFYVSCRITKIKNNII